MMMYDAAVITFISVFSEKKKKKSKRCAGTDIACGL
jgi:hypothetical protein